MRKCLNCNKSIDGKHKNRKYCSNVCVEKSRYKRYGIRSTSEQRSKWYNNRKLQPGYIEKLREQANNRNKKIKDFLSEYKIKLGCKDCGYKKSPYALDFDHINGVKEFNVCFAKSIKQAKEEIKKCEVVCANCHRIRTTKRYRKRKNDKSM